MPPPSREGDVLRALRELVPTDEHPGVSSEAVASRAGMADRATRRHLYALEDAGRAQRVAGDVWPYRASWRPR